MECRKQSRKKYTSRKSPPYPARACYNVDPDMIVVGNDGEDYEIRVASNGVPRWARVSATVRKRRKSAKKSRSKKRKSAKKTLGKKRKMIRPETVSVSKMTRAQLIKRLRYWRDRWERASGKHQDLDNDRLREMPLVALRKALRGYLSDESMEWLADYEYD